MQKGTHFDAELCSTLDNGHHSEEQKFVQQIYNDMGVVVSYLSQIPSIIVIIFGSAWSDLHGRHIQLKSVFFYHVF